MAGPTRQLLQLLLSLLVVTTTLGSQIEVVEVLHTSSDHQIVTQDYWKQFNPFMTQLDSADTENRTLLLSMPHIHEFLVPPELLEAIASHLSNASWLAALADEYRTRGGHDMGSLTAVLADLGRLATRENVTIPVDVLDKLCWRALVRRERQSYLRQWVGKAVDTFFNSSEATSLQRNDSSLFSDYLHNIFEHDWLPLDEILADTMDHYKLRSELTEQMGTAFEGADIDDGLPALDDLFSFPIDLEMGMGMEINESWLGIDDVANSEVAAITWNTTWVEEIGSDDTGAEVYSVGDTSEQSAEDKVTSDTNSTWVDSSWEGETVDWIDDAAEDGGGAMELRMRSDNVELEMHAEPEHIVEDEADDNVESREENVVVEMEATVDVQQEPEPSPEPEYIPEADTEGGSEPTDSPQGDAAAEIETADFEPQTQAEPEPEPIPEPEIEHLQDESEETLDDELATEQTEQVDTEAEPHPEPENGAESKEKIGHGKISATQTDALHDADSDEAMKTRTRATISKHHEASEEDTSEHHKDSEERDSELQETSEEDTSEHHRDSEERDSELQETSEEEESEENKERLIRRVIRTPYDVAEERIVKDHGTTYARFVNIPAHKRSQVKSPSGRMMPAPHPRHMFAIGGTLN